MKLLIEKFTINEWFSTREFHLRIFHHRNESGCIDTKEKGHRSNEYLSSLRQWFHSVIIAYCPNKYYRSVCWLKITGCMDQHNVSNDFIHLSCSHMLYESVQNCLPIGNYMEVELSGLSPVQSFYSAILHW